MPEGYATGAAYIPVLPSFRGWAAKVREEVRKLPDGEVDLMPRVDSKAARAEMSRLEREAQSLDGGSIAVTANTAQADSKLRQTERQARALDGTTSTVTADADTSRARAGLRGTSRQASQLDGRRVNVTVSADGAARAVAVMGALTAAISGVAASAPAAAAAVATIPAAAGAAGQGIAAVKAGFAGVGDAITAMESADRQAATTASSAASSRAAAARQVESAVSSLEDAQIQADRAAIRGSQQVEQAREQLAQARVTASRRVTTAEQTLESAQRSARRAQENLNRAREDAKERLEDMRLSLSGAALDEDAAELSLQRARQRLAEARAEGATGLDLSEAELGVRQAEQTLAEVRERYADLREDSERASRAGVEGDSQVIAAHRQVQRSTEAVQQAEEELRQARVDGARQVAQAQEQLAQAQQQASWAQQDAARRVARAQRAVTAAMQATGDSGSAALRRARYELEQLTPAGQDFVRFTRDQLQPALDDITAGAQAAMLPRIQTAMTRLLGLTPLVSDALADTSAVVGELAISGSEMVTSGPWTRDFRTVAASNTALLRSYGQAGLETADAFRSISVASLPLAGRLADVTLNAATAFNEFIQGKRASGELQVFFAEMSDMLDEVIDTLGQVAVATGQWLEALGPLGGVLIDLIGNTAELLGNLADANPTLVQFAAAVGLGTTALVGIGKAIAGASAAADLARSGYAKLGSAITSAGDRAGTLTERLTGSAEAGQRVGRTTSSMARGLNKIGSTLPIVGAALVAGGLALESYNSRLDETAKGLLAGGAAAETATERIMRIQSGVESTRDVLGDWGASIHEFFVPSLEEAQQKARELYEQMGPLEQAQQDVATATAEYQQHLDEYGENAPSTRLQAELLADAQQRLETIQRQAADATRSHTEALLDQQNVMLGAAEADLQFRQSKLQVQRAQENLTETVQRYGESSLETRSAQYQYEQSLYAVVRAAGEAARANYEHKDSAEANKAAMQAQAKALVDLLVEAGENAPPALERMVSKLDKTALSAAGAKVRTDELGRSIAVLPNGHEIRISTPGLQQAKAGFDSFRAQMEWINNHSQMEIHLKYLLDRESFRTDYSDAPPLPLPPPGSGQAQGHVVQPFAAGGLQPMDPIAQVVPPRTWRVVGDRLTDDEAYIPINESERSRRILVETAQRMGYGLVPMASGAVGMAQGGSTGGSSGSSVSGGGLPFTAEDTEELTTAVAALQAALVELDDTSQVATTTLSALRVEVLRQAVPALRDLERHAGVRSVQAVEALADTLSPLQSEVGRTSAVVSRSWQHMSGEAVSAQRRHEQVFRGLDAGLRDVGAAFDRTAIWVRDTWGRMRGYAADPVRWVLQNPFNAGLVPAWNRVNEQFAMDNPLAPVPVPFASGGPVTGGTPGRDSVPAMLMPGEVVLSRQAVDNLGGTASVSRFHEQAQQGPLHFAQGGAVPGSGGYVRSQFANTLSALDEMPARFASRMGEAADAMVRRAIDGIVDWSGDHLVPQGTTGNVESWRPTVLQALAMTGQPASLADRVLMQMESESGGNPRAINLWDINAQRGIPSKGLMQVIPPTFQAYRDPALPNDVYDPLANIVASIRYALNRYGSLQSAYRGVGYDEGGWLPPGAGQVYNATGQPEAVLTNEQWQLLRSAAFNAAGGGDTYNIYESTNASSVASEIDRRRSFAARTKA